LGPQEDFSGVTAKAPEEAESLRGHGHGAAQPAPGTGKPGSEQPAACLARPRMASACVRRTRGQGQTAAGSRESWKTPQQKRNNLADLKRTGAFFNAVQSLRFAEQRWDFPEGLAFRYWKNTAVLACSYAAPHLHLYTFKQTNSSGAIMSYQNVALEKIGASKSQV